MRSAAAHAYAEVVDLAEFRRRRDEQRMHEEQAARPAEAPSAVAVPVVWYPVWVCVTPCLGG